VGVLTNGFIQNQLQQAFRAFVSGEVWVRFEDRGLDVIGLHSKVAKGYQADVLGAFELVSA